MTRRTAVPAEFASSPDWDTRDQEAALDSVERPGPDDLAPSAPAPAVPMATDRQLAFLRSLLAERDIPAEAHATLTARVESNAISKSRASNFIERLLKAPKKQGAARPGRFPVRFQTMELDGGKSRELGFVDVNGREVPQGKYALDTAQLNGDWTNEIAFFNLYVARGDDGPFYSLKMYVSDDLVRMNGERQREVLERISLAPAVASALYGLHRTRCGICNRKLTADESRERGIGPVCAERMGW